MKLQNNMAFKILLVLGLSLLTLANNINLEETSEAELSTLLQEEKYLLVLFSKDSECTKECKEKEQALLNIREELAEAVGAWVIRTFAPSVLAGWGGDTNTDSIVFVRNQRPMIYTGSFRDEDEFLNYLLLNKESNVKSLTDATFEHETQASSGATTGDWLVVFMKDDCEECTKLTAHIETSAASLRGKKNVALIRREEESAVTTRRFGVTSFPDVILFRLGSMYRFNLPTMTTSTLSAFAEDGFRNAKAEKIPLPKTPFDDVTQAIADWLRENPLQFAGGVCGVVGVILLLILLNSPPPASWLKQKKKKK